MPRTVLMNSDIIKDKVTDLNFLQEIGKYLDFWGVPYKIFSWEVTPHASVMVHAKQTDDVVFMHNSLICPGTIVDVCKPWFQNMKAKRKYLWNFYTSTEDFAFTVEYQARSKDDNFSPASFKGLSQPVRYMVQNGAFHVNSTIDPRKVARRLAMLAYEK
jgi:hypothetical protein